MLLSSLLTGVSALAQIPIASSCAADTAIESKERAAIEDVGLRFLKSLLSADPSSAYEMLTKEARRQTTPEAFSSFSQGLWHSLEPKNIRVGHSYSIRVLSGPPSNVATCGESNEPDKFVTMHIDGHPQQAYVLGLADGVNNQAAFPVWMVREGGSWKVQGAVFLITTQADKSTTEIWNMARQENARGHALNAALLYATARQMAGNDLFQFGILQPISAEMAALNPPQEIGGQPPFIWKVGSQSFQIRQLGPMAIGGKLFLILERIVDPWPGDEQVDRTSKELIAFTKKRFPEYKEVFAGVIVRAHDESGAHGFGTVDDDKPASSGPSDPKR